LLGRAGAGATGAPPPQEPVPSGRKVYLRGLHPFEQGEALLGRGADLGQILVTVTSPEFRFGFSGEAGCGKTSLQRAGIIGRPRRQVLAVIYVDKPGADPAAAVARAVQKRLGDQPLEAAPSLHDLVAAALLRLPGRPLWCAPLEEQEMATRWRRGYGESSWPQQAVTYRHSQRI
jgi:hypothetical protein